MRLESVSDEVTIVVLLLSRTNLVWTSHELRSDIRSGSTKHKACAITFGRRAANSAASSLSLLGVHMEPFHVPDRLIQRLFSSTLLTMFSHRTLRILAIAILACQVASLTSWHSAHFDDLFWYGRAQTQVSSHADADHCKHLPLSEHAQCGICTSVHSRISLEPSSDNLGLLQVVGQYVAASSTCSTQLLPLDSFYRRGPPALLG
jgi:hypothetical protein